MRTNTILLLTLLICALSPYEASARSGEYLIEIENEKKFLNVQKLDLAPTTKLSELLEMFPELLARESDDRLQNYDLQVEGVSAGDSKLMVIEQLTLADIQDIEVSQTPSASQQRDGQGGVIKVKLKPLKEGISGQAFFGAGSTLFVTPGVRLNYQKGPWAVRGLALMNYYHPFNETSAREQVTKQVTKYQNDTSAVDIGYEMVNLDVLFTPDKHNKLHLWGWERLSFNSNLTYSRVESNSVSTNESYLQKSNNFGWMVGAKYSHFFDKSEVEAECSYENAPGSCTYDKYIHSVDKSTNYLKYADNSLNSKLVSSLKYKYNFVPVSATSKALLTGGVNLNLTNDGLNYDYDRRLPHIGLHGNSSLLYLSPFIETDNIFGNWTLKASVRYMHYSHNMDAQEGSPYNRLEDYLTGFINAGWQIAPHHHVRLVLDRSLQRGNFQQLYPYNIYDPSKETFSVGNASLHPVVTNSVSANYITDFKANDNIFTFDFELKYMYNTNIISQYYSGDGVLCYKNDGVSNIGAANFLFHFANKVFDLSLTANTFSNFKQIAQADDQYFFYNLAVVPALKFNGGWVISAKFAYNSHVYTKTSRLGNYFYANTRCSKSWDKWTLYLELDDNFHKMAEDEFFKGAMHEWYRHNLHKPSFSAGFQFNF